MTDKQFRAFVFIVLMLLFLWWLLHRHNQRTRAENQSAPLPVGSINDPELLTYAADPSAFGPRTINGSVNIEVNGYNGLNQNYMPLFGFVGMAQGEMYQ